MKPEVFELLDSGFFDGVNMDSKFSVEGLQRLWEMFRGRKYALKYYLLHHSIAPTFGSEEMQNAERAEEVYKKALEEDKTWQEVIGYKETGKDVLL